ncbi:MAG: hypothetical protein J0L92_34445 [Deltaproteobacteria bacterium]|nr:hypothetical protein [Deltaproteobacteria bacterium]
MQRPTFTALTSITLALSSVAALSMVMGCSPVAPTDGFYACATGGCPAAYPYCDPDDQRCYASAPPDTGPRPDTGPAPDAWAAMGTVPRYGVCTTNESCVPGQSLECVDGACVQRCTGMGSTCSPGVCAPRELRRPGFVCLDPCDGGAVCPSGATRREDTDSGRTICHCVPMSW